MGTINRKPLAAAGATVPPSLSRVPGVVVPVATLTGFSKTGTAFPDNYGDPTTLRVMIRKAVTLSQATFRLQSRHASTRVTLAVYRSDAGWAQGPLLTQSAPLPVTTDGSYTFTFADTLNMAAGTPLLLVLMPTATNVALAEVFVNQQLPVPYMDLAEQVQWFGTSDVRTGIPVDAVLAFTTDIPKGVRGPLDASDFPVVTSLDALLPGQVAMLDNGTDPPRLVRKRLDGTAPPLAGEVALSALTARVGTLEAQAGGSAGIYLKTDPGQGFTPSDRIVGDAGNYRTVGPILAATSSDRVFKRVRIPLRPVSAGDAAIGKTLVLAIFSLSGSVILTRRSVTITANMTEAVFEGPFTIPAGQQHAYTYGMQEDAWNTYLYLFYGNGSAYAPPNAGIVSAFSDGVPPAEGQPWNPSSINSKHRAIICEADGVVKNVRGPLDPSDFPVVTSLDQLLAGQVALLDNGTDPPRLARRRLDGVVPPSATEVELAALRAILPLPRVGIRSVLPRVARDGSEGDAWTYAPIARNTDPVGNWAPDLTEGWVTVPRTGVYTVSVTYVLICNGSQAYNIVLFSDQAGEKMKVVENRADGAVGGTAAGIIQAVAGERFRLGFRTGASAYLYDLDLNHWTVRQEAD